MNVFSRVKTFVHPNLCKSLALIATCIVSSSCVEMDEFSLDGVTVFESDQKYLRKTVSNLGLQISNELRSESFDGFERNDNDSPGRWGCEESRKGSTFIVAPDNSHSNNIEMTFGFLIRYALYFDEEGFLQCMEARHLDMKPSESKIYRARSSFG